MKKLIIGSALLIFILLVAIAGAVNTNISNTAAIFFEEKAELKNRSIYDANILPVIDAIQEYDQVYVKPSRLLGIFYHINQEPSQEEVMKLAQKCYICAVNYYSMKWVIPEPYYDENGNKIQPEAYEEKVLEKQELDDVKSLKYNAATKTWSGTKWQPRQGADSKYIQERECGFLEDEAFVENIVKGYILKGMIDGKEKEYQVMNINSAIGYYTPLDQDIPNHFSHIRNLLKDISDEAFASIEGSEGWIRPISGGAVSANTWRYQKGGIHLGEDFADVIGTPIRAAGNGVILASFDGCSNNGHLGNGCSAGGTIGGGNQVYLLTDIEGTLYVVKYLHMSPGTVKPTGTIVQAGEMIGQLGNSGNSSGAHVHVEIFNLGIQDLTSFVRNWNGDLSFENGYGEIALQNTCAVKGSSPCRERPEEKFGG